MAGKGREGKQQQQKEEEEVNKVGKLRFSTRAQS